MKPLALALAAAFVFASRQTQTYSLVWQPKVNESLSYKMELAIDSSPERFTFTGVINNRVAKIKSNGDYDVETIVKDSRVKHGDHDDPLPDDGKPTTDTYNRRGEKIATTEVESGDDDNPGLSAIDSITDGLAPMAPVRIGEKWSATIKASAKLKREAAKVTYTLAGSQPQGSFHTLKILFTYKQTEIEPPLLADGYILVDEHNFSMVRFEALLKGAHMSSDPDFPNGDTTVSVVRN